jgi:3-deoxy-D-arabino-heptulosonate 7-phosphate (DAHP) synthase
VPPLSAAALAAGAAGLIVEVHPDPSNAVSDGAQSLDFAMFAELAALVHPKENRGSGAAGELGSGVAVMQG